MKVEKINYQKVFPIGPYMNEKIGIEIQVEDGDSVTDVLAAAKNIVESWHKASNPDLIDLRFQQTVAELNGIHAVPERVEKVLSKEERTPALIRDINSCTELKVLESYKFIVRANPELQDAYDKKIIELKK